MHIGICQRVACIAAASLLACSQRNATSTGTPEAPGAAGETATESTSASRTTSAQESGGCGATVPEEGFVEVPPSDPHVRYVGRFDLARPDAPEMAFPASTIELGFEGDAIDLSLEEGAGTGDSTTQYYEVRIDDAPWVKLQTCPQQRVYQLARDLEPGSHRIRVSKRTEGMVGSARFLGFRVREGTELSLPAAPERRMEFVGDSITCGYGNEVSTTDPDSFHFTSHNENALLAYGAVAAKALDADYVAVAASGRGMVRNYNGGGGSHAPDYYELAGPDATDASWDHGGYSPDVVVVNLGTNDFSIGLTTDEVLEMREEYRTAYASFLNRLRELHPAAALIAAVGPMITDSYPTGYRAWTSIRADVQEVVNGFEDAGDQGVFYFEFAPQSSPYGEDWHPTIATHQEMADSLVMFIQEELGW